MTRKRFMKKGKNHARRPFFSQRAQRQALKAFQTNDAQVGRKIRR
jgi:hypothetical protein